ncbi:MAG: ABC transporter permease [Planctomycetes bacterium]|nr:ABC transporter permease [Planctomycetota bacterium]
MFQWFIAWRYITSRFITLAAFLLVALSVAILIILLGIMEGFQNEMIERIRGTSADLKIVSSRFVGLEDYEAVQKIAGAIPGVRATIPYVETLAMFQLVLPAEFESTSEYLTLQIQDLKREAQVGKLNEYIHNYYSKSPDLPQTAEEILSRDWIEKRLWDRPWGLRQRLSAGKNRPENLGDLKPALIGSEVFPPAYGDLTGLEIEFTTLSPVTNLPRTQRFTIAGYFTSKDMLQDTRTALLQLEDGIPFLDLLNPETGKTAVSGLRIYLQPGVEAAALKEPLLAALAQAGVPFIRVHTWREEKEKILRAVQTEKGLVGLILAVIGVFVALIIFIILTVQVVERTKDIGILLSVGSTPRAILGIYLRIGALICLAGIGLGVLYGVSFCLSLDTIQRWVYILTGKEVFPKDIYYIDRIPVQLTTADLLKTILLAVSTTFIATRQAARRAARKDPVEALRYE